MRAWGLTRRRESQPLLADPSALRDELSRAYQRGRRDQRARGRHPVLAVLLVGAAVVGAVLVFAAGQQGSFARGGQVVDAQINRAVSAAPGVIGAAEDRAGDALRSAGSRFQKHGAELAATQGQDQAR